MEVIGLDQGARLPRSLAAEARALLLRFRLEEPDADSLLSGELRMDVAALTRLHVHDRLEAELVAIESQRFIVIANQHHLSSNRSQHASAPGTIVS